MKFATVLVLILVAIVAIGATDTLDSLADVLKLQSREPALTANTGQAVVTPQISAQPTTIFGLSPTAAVIIAAALLVVVILAIVAMTRRSVETTYIDYDRRPPDPPDKRDWRQNIGAKPVEPRPKDGRSGKG